MNHVLISTCTTNSTSGCTEYNNTKYNNVDQQTSRALTRTAVQCCISVRGCQQQLLRIVVLASMLDRPATGWHATPNNTRQSKCRHPAAGDLPHSARAQRDLLKPTLEATYTFCVCDINTCILWLIHSRVPTPTWQQFLCYCATPGHTQSSHPKPALADTGFATHRTACMLHAILSFAFRTGS